MNVSTSGSTMSTGPALKTEGFISFRFNVSDCSLCVCVCVHVLSQVSRVGLCLKTHVRKIHLSLFFQSIYDCPRYVSFSAAGAHRKIAESWLLDRSVKLLSMCSRSMRNTTQIGSKIQNREVILNLGYLSTMSTNLISVLTELHFWYIMPSQPIRLQTSLLLIVAVALSGCSQ